MKGKTKQELALLQLRADSRVVFSSLYKGTYAGFLLFIYL